MMATHSNILAWKTPWRSTVHGVAEVDTTEQLNHQPMIAVYFYDLLFEKITLTKYTIINYVTLLKEHMFITIALKTITHTCTESRIIMGINIHSRRQLKCMTGKIGCPKTIFEPTW